MINKEDKRYLIEEFSHCYNEETLLLDGFDDAFIGMVGRINLGPVACYNVEKILEILEHRDGMTCEDAIEYFDYNISGSYMGENSPCFLNMM